jgi:hypothetical protein
LRQFPITEAEGGVPEYTATDLAYKRASTFPHNQILPYCPGGATKGSMIFKNRFGDSAQGPGSVQPIPIPDYHYFGGYPLGLQPAPDKPQPWTSGAGPGMV